MKAVILGAGGIGYYLAPHLLRLLENVSKVKTALDKKPNEHVLELVERLLNTDELLIVDGDLIEDKNLDRVFRADVVGTNKAVALSRLLEPEAKKIKINTFPQFIDEDSAVDHEWLFEDSPLIFSCVDNNPTRRLIFSSLAQAEDCINIDGGNDEDSGQVVYWQRSKGVDITESPLQIFEELSHKKSDEKFPTQHCLERVISEPQSFVTNAQVALSMVTTVLRIIKNNSLPKRHLTLV